MNTEMKKNGKDINIKNIPVMPQVATKIIQLQEDNLQISFKELENVILLDPAITARILKVANSALYARQREITNLQQAITLLGFKMIKSMILLICASNIYGKFRKNFTSSSESIISKSSAVGMWRHLVLTAFVAKSLATRLKLEEKKEDIFISGLLHDIGRVVLMVNETEVYKEFLKVITDRPEKDVLAIEEDLFGYNHLEVGKIVLVKWNFPNELIDVISQHHTKHIDSPHKNSVMIVGLSNLYARILVKERLSPIDLELQEEYIRSLSITEEVNEYYSEQFLKDVEKDGLFEVTSNLL